MAKLGGSPSKSMGETLEIAVAYSHVHWILENNIPHSNTPNKGPMANPQETPKNQGEP